MGGKGAFQSLAIDHGIRQIADQLHGYSRQGFPQITHIKVDFFRRAINAS